jgi:hypothetical protein
MNCPACGLAVPSNNVSALLRAARCGACDQLFDTGTGQRAALPRALPPEALQPPKGWQLDELSGAFTARWRWFGGATLVLVPFTLLWNAFLVGMAANVLSDGTNPLLLLAGLALPHTWVGVGLLYFVIASFVNTTTVGVAGGQLSVHHGPLWWPGRTTLPRETLQQLFVVEQRAKNRTTFQLCALLRDGSRRKLLGSLESSAHAHFLEARLERVLGISDAPVDGERPRG